MTPPKHFRANEREPALNWLHRQVRDWSGVVAWCCAVAFTLVVLAQALLFLQHGIWPAQPAAKFGLLEFAKTENWIGWNWIIAQVEALPIHAFIVAVGFSAASIKMTLS
jgi:hypothetical protein